MTLFYRTTNQVQLSSICINSCESYALFETQNTGNTMCSFRHFSPTCFNILSWNFAHDFVLLYYRSSSSVVTLRQFWKELCLFVNLEYRLCADFRTFLLHALTYWAQILHKTLFHRITDQVRVSSICINSWGSFAPIGTSNTGNTQFSALFSYMLLHIELKVCIWLCITVLQIKFVCCEFVSIGVRVMPLLELRILKIHSFPHFSLTCFDILSWNFAYDFVLPHYRLGSSVVNLHQFLWELCPFWNLEYWKYSFPHFPLTCFDILSWNFAYDFVLLYFKFECRQFPLLFIRPSSDGTYYGMVMSVRPSVHPSVRSPSGRFPHFSPTPFDIWSWNFAHDIVLMYYRSSLSVVTLRQFLKELCPFGNLGYSKCEVFRVFLLHALTYWDEILHRTLFYCISDQVRVPSICVYCWRSYASFWT